LTLKTPRPLPGINRLGQLWEFKLCAVFKHHFGKRRNSRNTNKYVHQLFNSIDQSGHVFRGQKPFWAEVVHATYE